MFWSRVRTEVLTTCAMVCAACYAILTGEMTGFMGRVVSRAPCEGHLLLWEINTGVRIFSIRLESCHSFCRVSFVPLCFAVVLVSCRYFYGLRVARATRAGPLNPGELTVRAL